MIKNELPSQKILKKIFTYNEHDGSLTKISSGYSSWRIGSKGYMQINLFGKTVLVHRIAWKIYYGEDPEYIDHINKCKTDNRMSNLRSVSHSANMRNKKLGSNNKSGFTGVHFLKKKKKWRARIGVDKKKLDLGLFNTKEEAISARQEAEKIYGYN